MKQPSPRIGTIVLAAALFALGVKVFLFDLAIVEGPSMLPTLRPGRIVLVCRAAYGLRLPLGLGRGGYLLRWASPRPGEIVAAANPQSGKAVIKRVGALAPDGAVLLFGDNPNRSLDSRDYGPVPVETIAGKVLFCGSTAEAHE